MACKAMSTVSVFAMTVGVLLAGTAAGLETGAEAKEAKPDDPSKRVCYTVRPTGTRMVHRECRTQKEWEDYARATQDSLLAQQRKNTATNPLTETHAGSRK
ncbi:MAG TPA: hypothetical protein VF548_14550 [Allosphingosinicella sp.]|jgi:hypothetical protein